MHTSTPPRGRRVVNIKSVTDETALLSVTLLSCANINMNQYINLYLYLYLDLDLYLYLYLDIYIKRYIYCLKYPKAVIC